MLSELTRRVRLAFRDPVLLEGDELCHSCRELMQREFERVVSDCHFDEGKTELLEWAVSRWKDEVEHRPLTNIHRRSLDDTWRQVIRFAGGDDVALVGQPHDALMA
jgi:CRISPR/Cas system-associated protein Cas10 (large subunit of type III CRISPR-Cas system)